MVGTCAWAIRSSQAQETHPEKMLEPALIPIRVGKALSLAERFKRNPTIQFPAVTKIDQRTSGDGHVEYIFEASDNTVFLVNAQTNDIDVTYRGFVPVNEAAKLNVRSEANLRQIAIVIKDKFYPMPEKLNTIKASNSSVFISIAQEDGSFKKFDPSFSTTVEFAETKEVNVKTLNRCFIKLRRDTGELMWFASRHREDLAIGQLNYSRDKALSIARWAITGGKAISIQVLLPSEFTAEQRKGWEIKNKSYRDAELLVEEDAWLHQRLIWAYNFNLGSVHIDAQSGDVVNIDSRPMVELDKKLFGLPREIVIPEPERQSLPATQIETASINFNSDNLIRLLHFQPIIRDNSPLIYADYFPNFLIKTEIKGDDITLEGQLKEKHKATLKLGEKKYTLDGKEAEFATPPVEIDDRIYLPAELLQKLNGVLIRWEPKKKLLWVDTRYLRR